MPWSMICIVIRSPEGFNTVGQFLPIFEATNRAGTAPGPEQILLSLLMAFVLSQIIAWVYCKTHMGLSYSRSYTQSLVLISVIVALVMIVVGNNIVTAFGLIGALALVRFRNVLKDTRDTVFIFASLVVGLASGSQKYESAIIGTLGYVLISLYLFYTGFGSMGHFDGYLRYRLPASSPSDAEVPNIIKRFCREARQISVRRFGTNPIADYTYHVRLRDRNRGQDLVSEVQGLGDVQDVTLVLQEEMSEV